MRVITLSVILGTSRKAGKLCYWMGLVFIRAKPGEKSHVQKLSDFLFISSVNDEV